VLAVVRELKVPGFVVWKAVQMDGVDGTTQEKSKHEGSALVRALTILASGLTVASVAVNLILQIVRFSKKRPVDAGQRDRVEAASLALTVARQLPGLIRQVRLLMGHLKT
jgi:hypothetical protein